MAEIHEEDVQGENIETEYTDDTEPDSECPSDHFVEKLKNILNNFIMDKWAQFESLIEEFTEAIQTEYKIKTSHNYAKPSLYKTCMIQLSYKGCTDVTGAVQWGKSSKTQQTQSTATSHMNASKKNFSIHQSHNQISAFTITKNVQTILPPTLPSQQKK